MVVDPLCSCTHRQHTHSETGCRMPGCGCELTAAQVQEAVRSG